MYRKQGRGAASRLAATLALARRRTGLPISLPGVSVFLFPGNAALSAPPHSRVRPVPQEKRALFDSVAPYSTSTALAPGPSPGGAMSPYAPRPLPGAGAGPSPAYRGTPLGALGVGRSPLAPGNLALRGRAAKYADVVRKVNAAGAAGSQRYSPVQDFAAACADESNGARGCRSGQCLVFLSVCFASQIAIEGACNSEECSLHNAAIAAGCAERMLCRYQCCRRSQLS